VLGRWRLLLELPRGSESLHNARNGQPAAESPPVLPHCEGSRLSALRTSWLDHIGVASADGRGAQAGVVRPLE
jgi:hypothetical protein